MTEPCITANKPRRRQRLARRGLTKTSFIGDKTLPGEARGNPSWGSRGSRRLPRAQLTERPRHHRQPAVWSTPAQLSAHPDGPVGVAIDGAGDALAVFEQLQAAGTSYTAVAYTSTRPAGGSWGPPALLSAPGDAAAGSRAVADTAGTFVVAWEDSTTQTLNVLTSPPGGSFAPATFPGVLAVGDLKIAPGHAVLTFTPVSSSGPMSVSESVS
jgi:hypothetical protein